MRVLELDRSQSQQKKEGFEGFKYWMVPWRFQRFLGWADWIDLRGLFSC